MTLDGKGNVFEKRFALTFFNEAGKGVRTHWGWYLLGTICVFIAFAIGQMPLTSLITFLQTRGKITGIQADEFYRTMDFNMVGISSVVGLLLLLVSFVFALVVMGLIVRYLHRRNVNSVISSQPLRWSRMLFAFIIWFGLTALSEVVLYFMDPGSYEIAFTWGSWIPLMVVVLLVLPLQTSFEETFIRGYLMQKIGLGTRRPWIAILLTSLLFASGHLSNPEVVEFGMPVMMTYYVSMGLFLAVITVLDDGLELALGIHAATNIYSAGFVSYNGSALQTDAIVRVQTIHPWATVVLFFASIVVFCIVIRRRYVLNSPAMIFSNLTPPTKVQEMPETP